MTCPSTSFFMSRLWRVRSSLGCGVSCLTKFVWNSHILLIETFENVYQRHNIINSKCTDNEVKQRKNSDLTPFHLQFVPQVIFRNKIRTKNNLLPRKWIRLLSLTSIKSYSARLKQINCKRSPTATNTTLTQSKQRWTLSFFQ